jgi:hypothetical protein
VFRVLVYLFVPLDVFVTHTSGFYHGYADQVWYQPLLVGRLLPLPVPTYDLTVFVQWAVVIAAVAAATGRAPRLLGWTVFALYFEWIVIAFSYGKVDHDRFAYLIALAVLPAVGKATLRDDRRSESAGWALRCVQLAVIATYFYAAFAKLRFGGPFWVDSATITRAVVRRGTELSDPLLAHPWTLHLTQWAIMLMELCSPVIFFLKERWQWRLVAFFVAFHVMTWAMITIIFLPHVLCLLAFLPLERLVPRRTPRRTPAGTIPGQSISPTDQTPASLTQLRP